MAGYVCGGRRGDYVYLHKGYTQEVVQSPFTKSKDINMFYWELNLPKMLNTEKHYIIVLTMEGFNLKKSRWHRQLIVLSFSPTLRIEKYV